MKIVGVNAGRAIPPRLDEANSRPLSDGSAALVSAGNIVCATIEERHTRKRYDGGFGRSLSTVLSSAKLQIEDIGAVGISTCCDSPWSDPRDVLDAIAEEVDGPGISSSLHAHFKGKVHSIDHHDSHAVLAFVGSGFQRSLVGVIDGFGNRRDDTGHFHWGADWWKGSFDRQTFYLAEWSEGKVRLERVLESSTGPTDLGYAGLYRAVTHFLGWPSYQMAGKTMALAGYGDPNALPNLNFISTCPNSTPDVRLSNFHYGPAGQIKSAIELAGYHLPDKVMLPATPDEPILADIAARLQLQLENALQKIVESLVDRYCVSNIAFGGGLAMNCVALGKLAVRCPNLEFYVPPAPSDTGQGLGNALWLTHSNHSPKSIACAPSPIRTAALGPIYSDQDIRNALESINPHHDNIRIRVFDHDWPLAQLVSKLLAEGQIVALRSGRSEYGPRALGSCSILADPRDKNAKEKVNRVKHREWFRPFGASVLAERSEEFFEGAVSSPFMSFAVPAKPITQNLAPGIVHANGTTRIQTVGSRESLLSLVLEAFYAETGLPMILNTSFNFAGDPLVETPADAVDVFMRSEIDALVLGRYFVTRERH